MRNKYPNFNLYKVGDSDDGISYHFEAIIYLV